MRQFCPFKSLLDRFEGNEWPNEQRNGGLPTFPSVVFSWRQFYGWLPPQGGCTQDHKAMRNGNYTMASLYVQLQRQKITQRGFETWCLRFLSFPFPPPPGQSRWQTAHLPQRGSEVSLGGLGAQVKRVSTVNPETQLQLLLRGKNSPRPVVLNF